uniref:Hemogen isoform X2 n=1 Tax=Geotrypetes seraphini TaxID=260995 RepID=A0A6P8NPB3_GEOSA|nr:hemogen isoform X2 [Geotrypetes seraphini]
MTDLEKDHPYSDFTQRPAAGEESEEHQIPVVTTRLRDRELLRKRKAEAQEKETFQEQNKHKRQRKGRGPRRGRGKHEAKEVEDQPEETQEENGQVHLQHEEEAALTVPEEIGDGAHSEIVEDVHEESPAHIAHREVPERDPEHETSDVLNLPLDSQQEDDEYYIPFF